MNLGAAIRTALINDTAISTQLGTYQGYPSVHTRRPVPESADYPMIVCAGDASITDEDGLTSLRPIITRDVLIYGEAIAHYRVVEQVGYLVRDLFHRNKQAITLSGYHIIDVVASGPQFAPTDDDQTVGRWVQLTIRLQPTP